MTSFSAAWTSRCPERQPGVVAVGMIVRLVVGIRFVVQVGNVVLMQVRMVVRMLVFHGGNAPYIINYL